MGPVDEHTVKASVLVIVITTLTGVVYAAMVLPMVRCQFCEGRGHFVEYEPEVQSGGSGCVRWTMVHPGYRHPCAGCERTGRVTLLSGWTTREIRELPGERFWPDDPWPDS